MELTRNLERYIRDIVPTLSDADAFYQDKRRPETLKQLQHMGVDAFFSEYQQHPQWISLGEALLGEPVEIQEALWFNKPPGTEHPTPPHQDNYYFKLKPPNLLTGWLAVDPIDEENGCLRYVPGSHQRGLRPHALTEVLGFSQGITDYSAEDRSRETVIHLQPDDLVAHHGETIHRAEPNQSATRHRRAFALVMREPEESYSHTELAPLPIEVLLEKATQAGSTELANAVVDNRPSSTGGAFLVLLGGGMTPGVEPGRLLRFDPSTDQLQILAEDEYMLGTVYTEEVSPERMSWMAHCLAAHLFLLDQGVPPEWLDNVANTCGRDSEQAFRAFETLVVSFMSDNVSDRLKQKLEEDTRRLYNKFLEIPVPHLVYSVNVEHKRMELAGRNSRKVTKIGRNAPCPCGSGRKYKKCCLSAHVHLELAAFDV